MTYSVKEIFYTLQGEGAQTGRAAVFCRFVGCNLWSGREEDRANAICKFCDTDFLGTDGPDGGKFATEAALADRIEQTWPSGSPSANKFVVFTGGEPLLQLDRRLIDAVHGRGFEIAVETNGTVAAPRGLDWTRLASRTEMATHPIHIKPLSNQRGLSEIGTPRYGFACRTAPQQNLSKHP